MTKPITLANGLQDEAAFAAANHQVLWGWKRDVGNCFRVVYFSGRIEAKGERIGLADRYFFYRHRLPSDGAAILRDVFDRSAALRELNCDIALIKGHVRGLSDLVVTMGVPAAEDIDRTARLQRRRPRSNLGEAANVSPATIWTMSDIFPADIYLGSGVSYEAGLPTLCDMHDIFGVDRDDKEDFTVGADDPLPGRLARDPVAVLKEFCSVHTKAIFAEPTAAMRAVKSLHEQGLIGKVFTDNVDNLLAKVGVPFERTRGSGVFNERYPATFANRNLIVVGVAADRRMLVRQARKGRGKVIVVNPCTAVAPKVRHLDYLRQGDLFLKIPAREFFGRVRDMMDGEAGRTAA